MALFVVLSFFIFVSEISTFKLSDSKLLLPYHSFNPVNYTLRGSDGACYYWHSGTPEVAVVIPTGGVNGLCSMEAVVTAVWQSPRRAVTTIYAKVSTTGQVVKCDVIVDDISRIEIETTTQELYLHNTPESLTVVAFDEYGNTFSTLDGVPFEWRIHGDSYNGAGNGYSVLRFLTWTESEYETPKSISNLETRGLQGHMHLVSGLRTGSAVVTASLMESVYHGVAVAHVRLLVLANAQLSPPLAYLMPLSQLQLQVRVIQQGSDKIIQMPSSQYHLQVNNTELLSLDAVDGCTITAKQYGQTEVALLDRNVEEALNNLQIVLHSETTSYDSPSRLPRRRLPSSLIFVVEPAYLGFTIIPTIETPSFCQQAVLSQPRSPVITEVTDSPPSSRNWFMEVGRIYVIVVDVYDKNSHRLHPSSNMRITFSVPSDRLKLIDSTKNGTRITVQALSSGLASVVATLSSVVNENEDMIPVTPAISGVQEISVYSAIIVSPSVVVLPWPSSDNSGFQLSAIGGTGQYKWLVTDAPTHFYNSRSNGSIRDVVTITDTGEVSALSLGESFVIASSPSHPQLCGVAKVIVSSPVSMQFVPGPSEVVVPDREHSHSYDAFNISLHIDDLSRQDPFVLLVGLAVLDSQGRSMADCRGLGVHFWPLDSSLLHVLPEFFSTRSEIYHSDRISECLRVGVKGVNTGFSELQATYTPSHFNLSVTGTTDATVQPTDHHPLSARFSIAVYRNIVFLRPFLSSAHVALGSTKMFIYTEGPQLWPQDSDGYVARIIPSNTYNETKLPSLAQEPHHFRPFRDVLVGSTGTSALLSDRKVRHMSFSLRCEEPGMFQYTLEAGNQPSELNLFPLTMFSRFTIFCEVPSILRLAVRPAFPEQVGGLPDCPLRNSSMIEFTDEVPIPNTASSHISLSFFGPSGNKLDSTDSIFTTVSLLKDDVSESGPSTSSDIVYDSSPVLHLPSDVMSYQSSPSVASDPYVLITPRKLGHSVGAVYVQVDSQLTPSVCAHLQSPVRLSSKLSVRLIAPVNLLPAGRLRLFHLSEAKLTISLVGGSGFFHVEQASEPNAARNGSVLFITELHHPTSLTSSSTSIHDFTIQSRHVGSVSLQVTDLCFPALSSRSDSTKPVTPIRIERVIDVVGLGSLALRVIDRIELGGQTNAVVDALDTNGDPLPVEFVRLLKLQVVQSAIPFVEQSTEVSRILGVPDVLEPSGTFGVGSTRFTVFGQALGSASLSIRATSMRSSVSEPVNVLSNVIEIQVFAPLTLSPCGFSLLVGAEYELRISGGPQPSSIEFTLGSPHKPLSIQLVTPNNALVRAHGTPGVVVILARAVSLPTMANTTELDTDPHSRGLVISNASCIINIATLTSLRIGCPLASSTELTSGQSSRLSLKSGSAQTPSVEARFMIACRSDSSKCHGAPLWAEGITSSPFTKGFIGPSAQTISPLSMARVVPPLRFRWRFNPPQPSSVARLAHYLADFNVESPEASLSSGMMLVAQAPGSVTVELMVESTDTTVVQMVDAAGHPIRRLITQLSVMVIPPLAMHSPFLGLPKDLILSPDSQFVLEPWKDIPPNSHIQYELVTVPSAGDITHGNTPFSVSSSGVVRCLSSVNLSASEPRASVRIRAWPKDHFVAANGAQSDYPYSPIAQTISIDLLMKVPRFALVSSTPGPYVHSNGLPSGGPYYLDITYHDELGRAFDAVSDKYLALQTHIHRTDILQAQVLPDSECHQSAVLGDMFKMNRRRPFCTTLVLRVSPDSLIEDTPSTTLNPVVRLSIGNDVTGFRPTYLSVPYGGELNLVRSRDLIVSQWTCLPEVIEGAIWSSSDSNVLWVDNEHRLMLARREGKVVLKYTIPASRPIGSVPNGSTDKIDTPSGKLSYTIRIQNSPFPTESLKLGAVQLVYVDTDGTLSESSSVALPITPSPNPSVAIPPTTVRFLVRSKVWGRTILNDNSVPITCPPQSETFRKLLASVAPMYCASRLISSTDSSVGLTHHTRLVPSWLSLLVLWNRTAPLKLDVDSPALVLNQLFTTQLEPVTQHSSFDQDSIYWQCTFRFTPLWHQLSPAFGLILNPTTRLQLQLRLSDPRYGESNVLSSTKLIPLPGFHLVIPPSIIPPDESGMASHSAFYVFGIDDPSKLTRQMLIFIPPSTSTLMTTKELEVDRPVVRSKMPSILDISMAPRPILSLTEVSQALKEYLHHTSSMKHWSGIPKSVMASLNLWNVMASENLQQIENEASMSSDDGVVKRHVLWIFELKASITDSPIDTLVDVVVSLRQTGQHISIPVHVRLPTKRDASAASDRRDLSLDALGFSWIHLFALVLITLLIAVAVHAMMRSATLVSSSTGAIVSKDLPPTATPPVQFRPSPRQLWSQEYSDQRSPSCSPWPTQTRLPRISPVNLSPTATVRSAGDNDLSFEEQKWRRALSGGSPSRLRDTFDSI